MDVVIQTFLEVHGSMTMGCDATLIFQDYLVDTIKQTSFKISHFFSLSATLTGPEVLFAIDQLFPMESPLVLIETRRLNDLNVASAAASASAASAAASAATAAASAAASAVPSVPWSFVKRSLHAQTQALKEDAQIAFIALVNVIVHQVIEGSRKKKTSKRISKREIEQFLCVEHSNY